VLIAALVMVFYWGQIEAAQAEVTYLHEREAEEQRQRGALAAEQERRIREGVARLTEDAHAASGNVDLIATSVDALSANVREVAQRLRRQAGRRHRGGPHAGDRRDRHPVEQRIG
jgi:hypothetical protein